MAVRLKVTPQWRCSKHIHNFLLLFCLSKFKRFHVYEYTENDLDCLVYNLGEYLNDNNMLDCHDGRRGAGLAASDRSIVYGVTSGARSQCRTGFHKYYWYLKSISYKYSYVSSP
ncbi:hypothetical protein ES288_D11G277500v1 [Gossypium darwinii]|uniref:Uncharacterized protein n=1 Tax=Gossypium darwinii TaxID=34276 RepID=A0A5D2AU00_GOSDA|nr:hypothetical protein ES288_D11G277500v1 [Gossypium darwinii]